LLRTPVMSRGDTPGVGTLAFVTACFRDIKVILTKTDRNGRTPKDVCGKMTE